MTTAPASTTVRSRVAELAADLIKPWQNGYLADRSNDVAALARLRRGAGHSALEIPDLWGLVNTDPLHQQDEQGTALSDVTLNRAEDALYTTLTLWALHQQSRRTRMHRLGTSEQPGGLGAAVRRLMPTGGIDEAVLKRLVRAGMAPDVVSLSKRLSDLVVLLRRADIPLDYSLLAGQLYAWQWPGGREAVRREWGRSFHTRQPQETANSNIDTGFDSDDRDAS
ncbi:type I-E CRISPR-associated protein Cse2/CasB [Streptomyces sp. NBC_00566]|uniref:type I-E CRISPR-associated protein Cse2/CasB n=1 Tax=Streptomyces sp. NBC_00566 TaxID=2975778 RepID=UPI002E7FC314|nr:type I-E CRISPR-associated protein Cse2/CasB [Streptomyces sp. NBC_00566]WUB90296.1 type I-E CRISPR-associated protein Cse2/CasB [Streptomyces sp. NBC_00566]